MPWAEKKKSDKRKDSGRQEEEEFYSTSQQERLDDLFQTGHEAFGGKQSGESFRFSRIKRRIQKGALVVSAILFVGYLIATSEEKGVTQSSPSQTKFVADSPLPNSDNSGAQSRPKPQPLPKNGTIRSFAQGQRSAPLKVNTRGSDHYLIKLTRPGSTEAVMYLFIRAGQSAEIKVPLGTFEIKWATGAEWYGYKKKFGESTAYGKAGKLVSFEQTSTEFIGHQITLYPVPSGNLSTKTISADEF